MARQISMLDGSGVTVAGFHSMRFTDGESWWKYKGAPNYSLGTALCYRREWWQRNPFKPMPIGEDNEFVYAAQAAGKIISEDAGDLMHATIHPGNTSPRMIADNWIKL